MNIVLHNLKVAFRNLMKYKLQTLISVLSIAIGIVTLSFTHSLLSRYQLPIVFNQPYADRTYMVKFKPINEEAKARVDNYKQNFYDLKDEDCMKIDTDIIRALKGNGGLRNAEKIVVPNTMAPNFPIKFHLTDSTIRKGNIQVKIMDPCYPDYAGIRSAITGKKIERLKAGEAIISEDAARKIFGDKNPIGAVQTQTGELMPLPITIVDVCESTPVLETFFNYCDLFFCVSDSIEDNYEYQFNFTLWMNVVMREGADEKDLQKEIDTRVVPLGYKSELIRIAEDPGMKKVFPIRMLIHVIGSLILLAAVIGFLRIEIQLFHVRRRELALRITNGASRRQVFGCILTEITIVIGLSIIIALLLGVLLQDFFDNNLIHLIDTTWLQLRIGRLWLLSIVTGIVLLVVCSTIAWIALWRMTKDGNSIVINLHKSRSHLFRNAMLCLQILICIVFVSCALIIFKAVDSVLEYNNVPEKDDMYSKYLYLDPYYASQPKQLLDEIGKLPDLDKMVMCEERYTPLKEIFDNPELNEKLDGGVYTKFYYTSDTVMLSELGLDVNWIRSDIDRNQCLILSEKAYDNFLEYGILDHSTLTIKYDELTLPIGGTVRYMPYAGKEDEFIVAVYPEWDNDSGYILIPKEGKHKILAHSIRKIIEQFEPQVINELVFNFRERSNSILGMAEAMRSAAWILGIVSMIICAMSIFSIITLDARARRKEVAIRKVNGAKSRDIYSMFGKVYLSLIAISLVIAIPLCVLFNREIVKLVNFMSIPITQSPLWPIIFGIVIVILLIFAIVGWQIHRVMQVDSAKIIAKE